MALFRPQKHRACGRAKALGREARPGTSVLSYGPDGDEEGAEVRDPCFHYTVLDQAWRATNTSTKFPMCDRNVKWKGEARRRRRVTRGSKRRRFSFICL